MHLVRCSKIHRVKYLPNICVLQRAGAQILDTSKKKTDTDFFFVRDRSYESKDFMHNKNKRRLRFGVGMHSMHFVSIKANASTLCITLWMRTYARKCCCSPMVYVYHSPFVYGVCGMYKRTTVYTRQSGYEPHTHTYDTLVHLNAIHFPFTQSFARLLFGCLER